MISSKYRAGLRTSVRPSKTVMYKMPTFRKYNLEKKTLDVMQKDATSIKKKMFEFIRSYGKKKCCSPRCK